jgi:hypothetical protein
VSDSRNFREIDNDFRLIAPDHVENRLQIARLDQHLAVKIVASDPDSRNWYASERGSLGLLQLLRVGNMLIDSELDHLSTALSVSGSRAIQTARRAFEKKCGLSVTNRRA